MFNPWAMAKGIFFLMFATRAILTDEQWNAYHESVLRDNEAYYQREREAELEWMYP